ncbi:MAG: PilZ domain-containing protein [Betaproteobacteria bacterium]|nr:PilZ domain-containing protein [Betaproteobacteria bacterium]
MDERRKHVRQRARIGCELLISATGQRFSGFTKNISYGGLEFEANESLTRGAHAVTPGTPAVLTFLLRKLGSFIELKQPCRIRYAAANMAGIEFTGSQPTPWQREALECMIEARSNRIE